MAKSQLEIVLVDENAEMPAPSAESVASSSASVPVRDQSATSAVPTPQQQRTEATRPERSDSPGQPRATERRDTTAVDVSARVAEMTVRAFGLGNLVSEIQRWQSILHDIGGLFKSSATSRAEGESPRARTAAQVEQATERPAAPERPESQQSAKRREKPEEQAAEHPAFASVRHFMRVTAPKAFGDFTSGAVDALRTFMGGPDSDDEPATTAVPGRPVVTAARDDRQQSPIKVQVNQPATSQPLGRKVLPPPLPNWTPPARPAPPTGIPLPTATTPTGGPPAAPPVIPAAYVPKPPIQTTAVPTTAVPTPATAAVPAASSAASTVSTAATVATAAPTAAPAAGGIVAALGPVGIAAAAVTAGFAALLIGSKKLAGVLGEAVQGVAGYSAHVSAATAETEVRRERASINRGVQIGPQMAQFERSRSRMEERFSQMGTDILELLLQLWTALEPFIDKSVSVAEAGVAGVGVVAADLAMIIDIMSPWDGVDVGGGMDRIAKANEKLAKEVSEVLNGEADKNDPLEDEFLESFMGLGAGMASKLGGPAAPRRRAKGGGP